MVELNPQALLAALEANHAHKADPGRKGCGIEKAIRAYLSAIPAPDDGLVERLELLISANRDVGGSDVRTSIREAATALQSKDEQIERLARALDGTNAQLTEQFELSTKYVAKNERLREALERIAAASPGNTNSRNANEAFSWAHSVARSALETQEGGK